MAELSAYRDQHYKVISFSFDLKSSLLTSYWMKASFWSFTHSFTPGNTRRARKKVGNKLDFVCGKFVVLHNRRTDTRVVFACWRPEKDHYGSRQGQKNSLWILLCWVSFAAEMRILKSHFIKFIIQMKHAYLFCNRILWQNPRFWSLVIRVVTRVSNHRRPKPIKWKSLYGEFELKILNTE